MILEDTNSRKSSNTLYLRNCAYKNLLCNLFYKHKTRFAGFLQSTAAFQTWFLVKIRTFRQNDEKKKKENNILVKVSQLLDSRINFLVNLLLLIDLNSFEFVSVPHMYYQ